MKTGTYHHSEETLKKMRLALRGKKSSMLGKRHTKESLEKMRAKKEGNQNPNWKGGETRRNGYVVVLQHDHPFADPNGYIKRGRLTMEAHLGRTLLPTEVVHHINGIKTDDRIENLMLFPSQGKHLSHHGRAK